ncbi:uncharacterized protein MELLADRAFT_103416 [Melampsora larici-populina 98AG31]|uniref:Secreted protein n=1 Tax=Melampsora larici-populina (strain 98AG31 / pathotype 3-4-7) TaxID=747676 RepID=F4RBE3_MELLP|nr:uncharacterized protein MELLADRAFT_103416 [Melampsora larici-populina 98AG31]EGG10375.1 hypothetical protein MELLADRAFT_103416 [Melampsora larici-populina 98AG31]
MSLKSSKMIKFICLSIVACLFIVSSSSKPFSSKSDITKLDTISKSTSKINKKKTKEEEEFISFTDWKARRDAKRNEESSSSGHKMKSQSNYWNEIDDDDDNDDGPPGFNSPLIHYPKDVDHSGEDDSKKTYFRTLSEKLLDQPEDTSEVNESDYFETFEEWKSVLKNPSKSKNNHWRK